MIRKKAKVAIGENRRGDLGSNGESQSRISYLVKLRSASVLFVFSGLPRICNTKERNVSGGQASQISSCHWPSTSRYTQRQALAV